MNIVHHPDPATLMAYATGTLPEAFAAVVACHVDLCAECARSAAGLDRVGGEMLLEQAGEALRPDALTATLARLDAAAVPRNRPTARPKMPRPLFERLGADFDGLNWKWFGPGVHQVRLALSSGTDWSLRLLKVAPRHKLPDHGHAGDEMTLVMVGAYNDSLGHFARGDVAEVGPDVEHRPIATADGDCICLVASAGKMKFKSLIGRVVQPLIGV